MQLSLALLAVGALTILAPSATTTPAPRDLGTLITQVASGSEILFGEKEEGMGELVEATDRPIGNDILVDCGEEEDIAHIDYIHLSPSQPKPGKPLKISAKGSFSEKVGDGAYVVVIVKMGLIKLLHKTYDVCAEVPKVDRKCPFGPGNETFEHSIDLPKEIPPGKFNVLARVYTVDDEPVACVKGSVTFKVGGRGLLPF